MGIDPSRCARSTASLKAPRCAGSRCPFAIASAATPCRPTSPAIAAMSAATVETGIERVPANAAPNGAAVYGSAGRSTAWTPAPARQSAPARAIASAITTSVPSGRCGPCASTAPTGRIAVSRSRGRSRTSSQVRSAQRGTVIHSSCRVLPPARRAFIMGGSDEPTMTHEPPERLNIADLFLDERVREGRGARTAIRTDSGTSTYAEVQALANRFAQALRQAGVQPEHRVILGMPDGLGYVAALFGILKVGGVAVMVNPGLPGGEVAWILDHARARAIVTHASHAEPFLK